MEHISRVMTRDTPTAPSQTSRRARANEGCPMDVSGAHYGAVESPVDES